MLKENCIKILGSGLTGTKISYKDVFSDIEPSEKDKDSDSLNSAERYNLDLRSKYQIQCFDAKDLYIVHKTRKFAYSYTIQLVKYAETLIKVLELAKDINSRLQTAIKTEKKLKKSPDIAPEDMDFQVSKMYVNNYLDILLEIKTRITDINTAECNHFIEKVYLGFNTRIGSMLETSFIPDEFAESFNSLGEKFPLHKFSDPEAQKLPQAAVIEKFKDLSTRFYSAAFKPFLTELMGIYYYFVTPQTFLNNPTGKALFVIPLSFYKKFNFAKSGLTREEMVFIDSSKSMEKNTRNLSQFYQELSDAMNCMYENLKEQKAKLFTTKDKLEIEDVIKAYDKFFCTKTEGNIRSVKEMLKNPLFREKFTLLVYDLRPDLLTEILTVNGNPWNIPRSYAEDDKLDMETTIYLYHLLKLCFGNKKFPSQRIQLVRLLHIFSYNDKPEKSFSRYVTCIEKDGLTWSNTEVGQRFREALER